MVRWAGVTSLGRSEPSFMALEKLKKANTDPENWQLNFELHAVS